MFDMGTGRTFRSAYGMGERLRNGNHGVYWILGLLPYPSFYARELLTFSREHGSVIASAIHST
jgi:hypothetical protein